MLKMSFELFFIPYLTMISVSYCIFYLRFLL